MNIDSREALATSLLAEVVYNDLPANAIGTTDSARHGLVAALLQSDTVDVAMGDEIGRRYALLSVRESGWSGFYAAVFQDRSTRQLYLAIRGTDTTSPLDLLNDVALVAGAAGGLLNQSESLRSYIAEIRADQAAGRLPPGSLTLTGHSLGGYLVQRAVFEYAGLATAAYTFNSAGIGGFLGLAGGPRYLLSSDNQFVQNFIAEPGLSVVSSWMSGLRPGREYTTFIEDQSGEAAPGSPPETVRGNHSIAPLADALGVYRVMDLLARGGQSFEQLTALLAATTRYSLDTLESTLSGIGRFFGVEADSRYTDGRARMHDLTFRLIEALEGPAGAGTGLMNLLGRAPDALTRIALEDTPQGLAVRYALMHGQPFAVTGVDYQTTVNADGRYDRERFSSEYLQARAEYAQLLFIANDADTTRPPADTPVSAATHHDVETGTVLTATGGPPGGRTVFGRDQQGPDADDGLPGTAHDDRLFGAGGNDLLDGGAGDDLLDGGPGDDTLIAGDGVNTLLGGAGADAYIIDAAATRTVIRGDDGRGAASGRDRIVITRDGTEFRLGSRPITQVSDGSGAWADDAGNRYMLASGGLRVLLDRGGGIDIEDFTSGDFGLDLGAALQAGPPPDAGHYTVQPLDGTPSGPATGQYGALGWSSPGAVYATAANEVVDALAPVVTAPGSQTQYVSVAAGFGDSQLVGDGGFNYLIDDRTTGTGVLVGTYGLGAEVGDDLLRGGGGDDWLVTQGGSDQSFGGDGDDVLIDSHATWDLTLSQQRGTPTRYGFESTEWVDAPDHASDDRMLGEAGDDYLIAHGGDQVMEGGPGDDEIYAGAGHDLLLGGAGNDVLGGDIRAADLMLRVTGTTPSGYREMSFDGDRLDHDVTHFGSDRLDGGDGNDVVYGGGGDDVLEGGDGDDALFGDFTSPYPATASWAAGLRDGIRNLPDLPLALHGDDQLSGGAGSDLIDAGGGDDAADGGGDSDTIQGGPGNDRLRGGSGADLLYGDPATDPGGRDVLFGDDGDDQLSGYAGDDELHGGTGSDVLRGGAGNDVLDGGDGVGDVDTLLGGDGDDTYRVSTVARVQIDDASGVNRIDYGVAAAVAPLTVRRASGAVRLEFGSGQPVVMSAGTFAALGSIRYADGTVLDRTAMEHAFRPDAIVDGRVVLGAGVRASDIGVHARNDDLLLGYAGPAGNWVDTSSFDARGIAYRFASGGEFGLEAGTRVLVLPNWFRADPGTYVRELAAPGEPAVNLAVLALSTPRVFIGSGDVSAGSGADTLLGGAGDDLLRGGAGDDLLRGAQGNDVLAGGTGNDRYEFHAGDGAKVIIDEGGVDDAVVLGAGMSPGTLVVSEGPGGLDVRIGAGGDRLLLTGWSRGSGASVDALQFADGARLDRDALDTLNTGNHSPRLAGAFPDQVLRAGASFRFTIPAGLFSDADAGDALAYTLRRADGGEVPAWLAFDVTAQSFTGTPPASAAGELAYVLEARDGAGLYSEAPLTIRVTSAVVLTGTGGNDVLRAGSSAPHEVYGLAGNDRLYGAAGADRLDGGAGDDRLEGGAGTDVLLGGAGNDTYVVDSVADAVVELPGEGTDTLQSAITVALPEGVENLSLTGTRAVNGTGNALDNLLLGNSNNNVLSGGGGNDLLDGGTAGADTLSGGPGDDTYVVNSTTDRVIEEVDQGIDGVRSTISWTLGPQVENLELIGTSAINAIGNGLDNVLVGSTRQNMLDGGAGNDTMSGGGGDDTYVVDSSGDTVIERPGEGTDLVRSSATFALSENIEHLTLTGSAAIDGTGNALANTLTGNSAANRLAGGAGNDTYIVDHPGDVVIESADQGIDQVLSSVSFVLGDHVEQLQLTGTSAIDGTGNALDNVLRGNTSSNVLTGGSGNDTYYVDRATDVVVELAGAGRDEVRSSATYVLPANVEKLVLESTATIDGTGNELDNHLIGNGAVNTLRGGAGNDLIDGGVNSDVMYGGPGNDYYRVNSRTDQVIESPGEGLDTVESLGDFTLSANVENLVLAMNAGLGTGNSLANEITGSGADNRLEGLGGDDVLRGGPGQDTLVGGDGADRYLYSTADGSDTVINTSNDLAIDRLVFTDLTLADLTFRREVDDLLVGNTRVAGAAVRVSGWFLGVQNQVDYIDTADGVATPASAIAARVSPASGGPVATASPVIDTAHQQLVHALAGFGEWNGETAWGLTGTPRVVDSHTWMTVGIAARELAA